MKYTVYQILKIAVTRTPSAANRRVKMAMTHPSQTVLCPWLPLYEEGHLTGVLYFIGSQSACKKKQKKTTISARKVFICRRLFKRRLSNVLTQGVICDYLSHGQTFSPQAHFSPCLKDSFIQTKHNAEANARQRIHSSQNTERFTSTVYISPIMPDCNTYFKLWITLIKVAYICMRNKRKDRCLVVI